MIKLKFRKKIKDKEEEIIEKLKERIPDLHEEDIEIQENTVIIKGDKYEDICGQIGGEFIEGIGCVVDEMEIGGNVKIMRKPNIKVITPTKERVPEEEEL